MVNLEHDNIKPPQVHDHKSAYLSAEQPFSRRRVHLPGNLGFALPHQMVMSSYVLKMIFWNLQERAGVRRL